MPKSSKKEPAPANALALASEKLAATPMTEAEFENEAGTALAKIENGEGVVAAPPISICYAGSKLTPDECLAKALECETAMCFHFSKFVDTAYQQGYYLWQAKLQIVAKDGLGQWKKWCVENKVHERLGVKDAALRNRIDLAERLDGEPPAKRSEILSYGYNKALIAVGLRTENKPSPSDFPPAPPPPATSQPSASQTAGGPADQHLAPHTSQQPATADTQTCASEPVKPKTPPTPGQPKPAEQPTPTAPAAPEPQTTATITSDTQPSEAVSPDAAEQPEPQPASSQTISSAPSGAAEPEDQPAKLYDVLVLSATRHNRRCSIKGQMKPTALQGVTLASINCAQFEPEFPEGFYLRFEKHNPPPPYANNELEDDQPDPEIEEKLNLISATADKVLAEKAKTPEQPAAPPVKRTAAKGKAKSKPNADEMADVQREKALRNIEPKPADAPATKRRRRTDEEVVDDLVAALKTKITDERIAKSEVLRVSAKKAFPEWLRDALGDMFERTDWVEGNTVDIYEMMDFCSIYREAHI